MDTERSEVYGQLKTELQGEHVEHPLGGDGECVFDKRDDKVGLL